MALNILTGAALVSRSEWPPIAGKKVGRAAEAIFTKKMIWSKALKLSIRHSSTNAAGNTTQCAASRTQKALGLLRDQPNYYAIVEIKSRPYHIAKNDLIITPRMNDLKLGDVIKLDRCREIGSPEYILQGNPYIDPSYFSISASVVEHTKSEQIVRRHWKRSGDDKFVSNASHHTKLRVCELNINEQS